MVERKLFKTKLCVLYQKGHCPRQSCSFAHGDAELRRFSGSFNGRHDYRSSDARNRFDRRHSPQRRYSPDRDARGRHTLRGYSRSSSPGRRSEKKRRKKQPGDGQSDFSESGKISDGSEGRSRDRKQTPSGSRGVIKEQLRQVQSDINMLNNHKCQLETYLEERVQEVDSLTSRIQELEMELGQEKEECKRITSKIKRFVKAHRRYSGLQDDLKRSHDRLQKLGDQLASDATELGATEDDSSINILNGDITANHKLSPLNQLQKISSPNKKKLVLNLETAEDFKSANPMKGEGTLTGGTRLAKHSRWNVQHAQFNDNREGEEVYNGISDHKIVANEEIPKRGKIVFTNVPAAEKFRGSEPGLVVPPTGMAAHAVDEALETIEMDDDLEVFETFFATVEKGDAHEIPDLPFPLPPPPPLPKNGISQYKGKYANVETVALEEDMVDVDIV